MLGSDGMKGLTNETKRLFNNKRFDGIIRRYGSYFAKSTKNIKRVRTFTDMENMMSMMNN